MRMHTRRSQTGALGKRSPQQVPGQSWWGSGGEAENHHVKLALKIVSVSGCG